jgi:hypothetical protein
MNADPKELEDLNDLAGTHLFALEAEAFLGLTDAEGSELFLGEGVAFNATLDEALKTLEILRDTGKIDWSHTRARYEAKLAIDPDAHA